MDRPHPAENLQNIRAGYLVVDADACPSEIPTANQINGSVLVLLTRARNRSEWASLYPSATVLSLPLKKSRFLQAISLPITGGDARARRLVLRPHSDRCPIVMC